jgi:hypothetical protein
VQRSSAAGLGESDVPGSPVEQLDSEVSFELADCSRQRRRGDVKPPPKHDEDFECVPAAMVVVASLSGTLFSGVLGPPGPDASRPESS